MALNRQKEEKEFITVSANTLVAQLKSQEWSYSEATNRFTYRFIDDEKGVTLVAAASNDKALAACMQRQRMA
jgi:hypothetical protein